MSVDGSLVETGDVVVSEEPHMHEGSPQYDKLPPPEKALFQLEKLRTHLDLIAGRVTLDNETGNNNGEVKEGLFGLRGFDWTLTPSIVSSEGKSSEVSLVIRPPGSNKRMSNVFDEMFTVISDYDEAQKALKPVRVRYVHDGIDAVSSDGSVQPITQRVTKIVGPIQPHG